MPHKTTLLEHSPTLAAQWHPTKNGRLTPDQVSRGSGKKVWWVCDKGHEWEAAILHRTSGSGCPVCAGKKVLPGVNDLATTHPNIASQWHPNKNGSLAPEQVTSMSGKTAWWVCDKGHEWNSQIASRTSGRGCPYCAPYGGVVLKGYSDLLTVNPGLAAQWHPTKNGSLTPDQVTRGSGKRVWWLCEKNHEWEATVSNRTKGRGCPYCVNRKILPGFNDLATANPTLSAQWHPTKNGTLSAEHVPTNCDKKVWWLCPDCGHEWEAKVANRTNGTGCPKCARAK